MGGPGCSAERNPGSTFAPFALEIALHQNVRVGNDFFVRQDVGGRVMLRRAKVGFAELLEQRGALRIGGRRAPGAAAGSVSVGSAW